MEALPHTAERVKEVASLIAVFYNECIRLGLPKRVAAQLSDSYFFQLMFVH
jgi:hypothetical protein